MARPAQDELQFLDQMAAYAQTLRSQGDFFKDFDDAVATKRAALQESIQHEATRQERVRRVKTEPAGEVAPIPIHGEDSDFMEEDVGDEGHFPRESGTEQSDYQTGTDAGDASQPWKRARRGRTSSSMRALAPPSG